MVVKIKKKRIGQVQVLFGLILLITTITFSIFFINYRYIDVVNSGLQVANNAENKFYQEQNFTERNNEDLEMLTHSTINIFTLGTTVFSFVCLFWGLSILIMLISIMFILQGLANIAMK